MENHLGKVWERESRVLSMNISGVQNAETFISQELKNYRKMHLEAVVYNANHSVLRLYFNPETTHTKPNNFLKQVSKKKHPDLEAFLASQKELDKEALLTVVELSKVYLLFFSEYAK